MSVEGSGRLLTSWKEIADYLGVTVRTAQRWEAEQGLPVRRLGGDRARVAADCSELDAWRLRSTSKRRPWNSLRFLRAYALVLTVAVVGYAVKETGSLIATLLSRVPASFQIFGEDLVVTDNTGREMWRHTTPEIAESSVYTAGFRTKGVWFGDLGPRQKANMLFTLVPQGQGHKGHLLYCFSSRGSVQWQFNPGRTVREDAATFSPPFHIRVLRVFPSPKKDGTKWVAVTSVHHWFHPCQVAILDEAGRLLYEYWHSGHLDAMETRDLDGDGIEEILLAGVNQQDRQATLVVLEPCKLDGKPLAQPSEPVPIPTSDPKILVAAASFPRTSLNYKLEEFNFAYEIGFTDGVVRVLVKEQIRGPWPYLIYDLDRNLNLVRLETSVNLANRYRELKALGVLDHEFSPALLERLRGKYRVERYEP